MKYHTDEPCGFLFHRRLLDVSSLPFAPQAFRVSARPAANIIENATLFVGGVAHRHLERATNLVFLALLGARKAQTQETLPSQTGLTTQTNRAILPQTKGKVLLSRTRFFIPTDKQRGFQSVNYYKIAV